MIYPNGQIGPDFNVGSISRVYGPLGALKQSPYNFSYRFYPRNLSMDQRGHYIIFYVNVAQNSKFYDNYAPVTDSSGRIFPGVSASRDEKLFNIPFTTDSETGKEKTFSLAAKTKRIQEAIALYMPENINVQYGANYQDTSLTGAFGNVGALLQNADSVRDAIEEGWKADWNNKISAMGAELSTAQAYDATSIAASQFFGQDAGDFVLFAGGYAINPQLEVLFKGINLRTFQFEFVFSPFSRDEAQSVQEIIKSFKYHAAPEVLEGAGNGRYMVPPSQFDIDFMYKGEKNKNIHQIGTCVLTNVSVDYAPDGWSSFGGNPNEMGAGSATQTKLTLQFMETDIVTKDRIMEGY
jgi:hypothetical protein